jgi:hypothetical protein
MFAGLNAMDDALIVRGFVVALPDNRERFLNRHRTPAIRRRRGSSRTPSPIARRTGPFEPVNGGNAG